MDPRWTPDGSRWLPMGRRWMVQPPELKALYVVMTATEISRVPWRAAICPVPSIAWGRRRSNVGGAARLSRPGTNASTRRTRSFRGSPAQGRRRGRSAMCESSVSMIEASGRQLHDCFPRRSCRTSKQWPTSSAAGSIGSPRLASTSRSPRSIRSVSQNVSPWQGDPSPSGEPRRTSRAQPSPALPLRRLHGRIKRLNCRAFSCG